MPGLMGPPPSSQTRSMQLSRRHDRTGTTAGREQLRLYRQVLLAGLKGARRRPTNLAQVRAVTQGLEETTVAFLERLMEAYRMYTHFDPSSPEHQGNVSMAFIGQSAPDIRNVAKDRRITGL